MRQDHLLSKEHLRPKGCEGPVPAVVSVGCSMAETLASSVRQRLLVLVLPPGGVWSGLVVRLGGASNILLGPEETSPLWWWGCSRVVQSLLWVAIPACVHAVGCVGGCLVVAGVGWWVGRCLRIAQWTRASLWSSCRGRTVNALAPGADEGRGRPR